MTSKREKVLWIIYALVLVFLFLMSSTDLIIKEEKQEVYPISVIIDDTTDDFYVNFKKGVDQASRDFHADVSFITLYERENADLQLERVIREINDGSRGVILSPLDDETISRALDENRIRSPLVVVNSELNHNRIAVTISEDHYGAGRLLAEHVKEEMPVQIPVYLLSSGRKSGARTLVYDGVMSVLSEAGFQTSFHEVDSEEGYRTLVEGLVYPARTRTVLVALDIESLSGIAKVLDESTVYRHYAYGVYGLGFDLQILNFLDSGTIDGIVVANDFLKGYLSIQKAVEAIQNAGIHETIRTDAFYIEKEDLRKKEYQKRLYPID